MRTLIVNQYLNAVFNPLIYNPALWLDPSDESSLTITGSSISSWLDKSGNSRNLVQESSTVQPTYSISGLNGKNVVSCSGDYMTADSSWVDYTNGLAIFVIAKQTASGTYILLSNRSGSNTDSRFQIILDSVGALTFRIMGSETTDKWIGRVTGALSLNTFRLLTFLYDGGSLVEIKANGTQIDTGNNNSSIFVKQSTVSPSPFRLGHQVNGRAAVFADYGEILYLDYYPDLPSINKIESEMMKKWGILSA